MKKIAVIGATGNLGIKITEYALEAGHTVQALSRHGGGLDISHKALKKFTGDILNRDDLKQTIQGCDVVVSAIGASGGSDLSVLYVGMKNVIAVSTVCKVSRIIAIGSSGVLQLDEHRLLRNAYYFPTNLKEASNAHLQAYHLIRDSNLDWTFVCPTEMHHGERSGDYRLKDTFSLPGTKEITYEDVADFIIREIDNPQYVNLRVAISY